MGELTDSLKERKNDPNATRYSLPTLVEASIDLFWEEDLESVNPVDHLNKIMGTVPERDINIGLFNLISDKRFEKLEDTQKKNLLKAIEDNFQLQPFMQKEIWAIRVVGHPDFGSALGESISAMSREDLTLIHPVIRRMILHFQKHPEGLVRAIQQLAQSKKNLNRFLESYDKFMKVRKPFLLPVHMDILVEILKNSPTKEKAFLILNLLDELKFQVRKSREEIFPVISELINVAKNHRRVALEILVKLASIARNDYASADFYVRDQVGFMDIISDHLEKGSFPMLLSAWVSYINSLKTPLEPMQLDKYLTVVEKSIKRYGDQITGTEHYNIYSSIKHLMSGSGSPVGNRILKMMEPESTEN